MSKSTCIVAGTGRGSWSRFMNRGGELAMIVMVMVRPGHGHESIPRGGHDPTPGVGHDPTLGVATIRS